MIEQGVDRRSEMGRHPKGWAGAGVGSAMLMGEGIPLIENEIVARFYFQKGKTVHSFSFSDVIKESRRILKTPSEYAKILNQ